MDNNDVLLRILDSIHEIENTLKNFTESLSKIIEHRNSEVEQILRVQEEVNKIYSSGNYMKPKSLSDLCNNCKAGDNYCESCREGKNKGIKCKYNMYQY